MQAEIEQFAALQGGMVPDKVLSWKREWDDVVDAWHLDFISIVGGGLSSQAVSPSLKHRSWFSCWAVPCPEP